MRVGLVLGAGGVQGGAWLTGALDAIAKETGWDPATADYIVGTSAGSMLGTLLAAGLPPWFMVAHSAGETFDGMTDARGGYAGDADRSAGAKFNLERGAIPWFPGSPGLALRSALKPWKHTPAGVISGWAPRGMISSEPLREIIRSAVDAHWTSHPNHWVVACDYSTGRRVTFGRRGAPDADLEDAVAASCAIPGFYKPVEILGRRYVDGGIWSASNLDVLRGQDLDLVVCFNPTSSLHPIRAISPSAAFGLVFNRANGRRLGSEAKRLRAEGTEVVLVQPTERDLKAMGVNLMRVGNRNSVIAIAKETVSDQLAEPGVAELLADLPAGDPDMITMPERPSWEWPGIEELAARVGPEAPGMPDADLPPLVLQHEASTPADFLGDWLRERGIEFETISVWEDGPPPDPTGRPWICSLGSDQTPGRDGSPEWVDAEVEFLRAALEADVPVLGLCFGGQALAVAAGGGVHPADPPAAGWAVVETADPGLIAAGPWLHFHYDQLEAPPGSTELARSPAGTAAFRLGRSLGLQFHPETGPAIAKVWAENERAALGAKDIDPDSVATGGEELGDRARQLAFELFDAWYTEVLGSP